MRAARRPAGWRHDLSDETVRAPGAGERGARAARRRSTLRRPGNMAGNEAFFDGFLDDYFAECEDHLTAAGDALLSWTPHAADRPPSAPCVDESLPILPFDERHLGDGGVAARPRARAPPRSITCARSAKAMSPCRADGIDVLDRRATRRLEQIDRRAPSYERAAADRRRRCTHFDRLCTPRPVALSGQPRPRRRGRSRASGSAPSCRRESCSQRASASTLSAARLERSVRSSMPRRGSAPTARSRSSLPLRASDGRPATLLDSCLQTLSSSHRARGRDPDRRRACDGSAHRAGRRAPSHVVRVDLGRLDELMRMSAIWSSAGRGSTTALARIEAHVPPAEWRAVQENTPSPSSGSCATCAKASCASGWCRSARSSGACRSSSATWRARPAAGHARAARPGHRDRQVPDRADDGSGAPPGAQRRQPRLRAAGGAASPPATPEGHASRSSAATRRRRRS